MMTAVSGVKGDWFVSGMQGLLSFFKSEVQFSRDLRRRPEEAIFLDRIWRSKRLIVSQVHFTRLFSACVFWICQWKSSK